MEESRYSDELSEVENPSIVKLMSLLYTLAAETYDADFANNRDKKIEIKSANKYRTNEQQVLIGEYIDRYLEPDGIIDQTLDSYHPHIQFKLLVLACRIAGFSTYTP